MLPETSSSSMTLLSIAAESLIVLAIGPATGLSSLTVTASVPVTASLFESRTS